jgi:hypothetical protein
MASSAGRYSQIIPMCSDMLNARPIVEVGLSQCVLKYAEKILPVDKTVDKELP